ncbi:hypothetical protein L198_03393 [Cryptococcus wingfieldii CBS 7118]|uniref:L domain-like protein n=1 Tax=Cryptococcus wingfieldii CBS 7118 TaxID=1295528 RepID=A0A1E3JFA3_9TREE|nr:hypothetical protein L198_03393 [Cryptococcus wingfieldii CBS 7118]ODN99549.1 hypothetical protein L198_03393 [Cryptococcus wingfieldii CBS 7118]
MDRGAARSRKRAEQSSKSAPGPSTTKSEKSAETRTGDGQDKKDERPPRKQRYGQGEQPKDPSLYKPKAVRSAAALIYSESAFPIPPPQESLKNVRRVDLSGSGAQDVSWLEGMGVTWLNLAGCPVEKGWEAVGTLSELTVLNISGTGLKQLPSALKDLPNLKALVAMNNEWTEIDSDVVGSWSQLNSIIVSHSPNLSSLPHSLSSLHHLNKITFSHCPRLSAASLPNLSSLPLLRDVKMNNLPSLTTLPAHISSWGKGDMSLVGKGGDEKQFGDGLLVLDLGNCSLDYQSIAPLFGLTASKRKPLWPHLRSLSLHSNPLSTSHPTYSELLQASPDLPSLQIVDAHRVKERKRKGEVQESKWEKKGRERRVGRERPTGANEAGGKMRKWGAEEETQEAASEENAEEEGTKPKKEKKERKEKKSEHAEKPSKKKRKHGVVDDSERAPEPAHKRNKHDKAPSPVPTSSAPDPTADLRNPAQETSTTVKDYRKDKSAVVGVVEVKKDGAEVKLTGNKRKKMQARGQAGQSGKGGVDLRELFGKEKAEEEAQEGEGSGLGVGGW